MKHFVYATVLGLAMVCFSSNVHAQQWVTVTVGFEQFADPIGPDWAWGGRPGFDYLVPFENGPWFEDFKTIGWVDGPYGTYMPAIQYIVDGVTFTYAGVDDTGYSMGFWQGTALSTRTTVDDGYNEFTNEMVSASGSGNNGSSVYGVVYGDSTVWLNYDDPMLPSIKFPSDVELVSIAITNTAYTWSSMTYGDQFADPNGWLDLIIFGVDADGNYVGEIVVELGSPENGVLIDWTTVDLTPLKGATELRFTWDSNDILDMGWGPEYIWYNYPVYFAYDDVTYRYQIDEPPTEPATLDIDGDGNVDEIDANLLLLYVNGFHENNPGWTKALLRFSDGARNTGDQALDYLDQNWSIFDLDGDGNVDEIDANLLLLCVNGFHENNPGWAKALLRFSDGTRNTGDQVLDYIESHLP